MLLILDLNFLCRYLAPDSSRILCTVTVLLRARWTRGGALLLHTRHLGHTTY